MTDTPASLAALLPELEIGSAPAPFPGGLPDGDGRLEQLALCRVRPSQTQVLVPAKRGAQYPSTARIDQPPCRLGCYQKLYRHQYNYFPTHFHVTCRETPLGRVPAAARRIVAKTMLFVCVESLDSTKQIEKIRLKQWS